MIFDIHRQPDWINNINKPSGDTPQSNGVRGNATGLTEGGLSAYPAALPPTPPALPAYDTARQTSVVIDVQSPSSKSRTASERDVTTVREKIVCQSSHIDRLSFSLLSLRLALKVGHQTKVNWINVLGHLYLEGPK